MNLSKTAGEGNLDHQKIAYVWQTVFYLTIWPSEQVVSFTDDQGYLVRTPAGAFEEAGTASSEGVAKNAIL